MNKLKSLKDWAFAVRQRDGKCMKCESTTSLVAHHIQSKSKFPELKLCLDNGITLCTECHVEHHKHNRDEIVKSDEAKANGKVALKNKINLLEKKVKLLENLHENILDQSQVSWLQDRNKILEQRFEQLIKTNENLRKENRALQGNLIEYELAYESMIGDAYELELGSSSERC